MRMPPDPDRKAARTDAQSLTIGALSRATRIPVGTLRSWERRYGFPVPERKPSGHRLYPASVVDHLRRVSRLLAQGHRPAEIVGLAPAELDALLSLTGSRAASDERAAASPAGDAPPDDTLREVIAATRDFDRARVLDLLRTSWVRLGPLRFLEDLAGPLLVEVGRAWHAGDLQVRHEHFVSACMSDFLRAAREPFDRRARGPRVVAATLPGEEHDGGLLIVSTLLALRGCRVVYLGASTPIEQIAEAARSGAAEAVVVSVSAAARRPKAATSLAVLRKALPSRVPIWLGGAGAPAGGKGIERFDSLAALDARLQG
jgi:methanogenic corrinoid protein MtbC1